MTFRCPDVWVLDGYLDEAGWDNQHQLIYFSTKRDAQEVGDALNKEFKDFNNSIGFQFEVYQIVPNGSFFEKQNELQELIKLLIIEWRNE